MLAYDPDRQLYSLGVRLVRLAHAAWATSSLAPIARPYLDEVSAETGETIHLAQMDNGQVLYVDKRNAAKPVEMFAQAGKVSSARIVNDRETGKVNSVLSSHADLDMLNSMMLRPPRKPTTL